jgi:hypothetical protein
MKGLVASFQQTTPCTRPANWSLSPIRLIFRDGLLDSREGPWEVMTPRSSCPGREPYSSPGRSKPPAFSNINTLARKAVWLPFQELATLSLGRMCTRNMLVARCVPVIRSATTKSLQNPTMLCGSPAAAFLPQRPKLALQASQFRDALFHVTDVGFQKRVDLTTVSFRCGAKSEQNPNFVQRHVKGTAMANERQQFGVLLPIASKIPTRPSRFRQQSFMLVIPNSLDSASRCPCEFADCHLFRPSASLA